MAHELWINLPVKDLKKSREFFKMLGFKLNERFADSEDMAGLVIGDHQVMVMLFPEATFQSFTGSPVADPQQGSEVLLSISMNSQREVREMTEKAKNAGGKVFAEPGERNGIYGAGFCDLDGHRWNLLIM
ncbi:VOC family protein [Planococcus ruber]|uniref:VOC family protein n=1 Tax=Planococcus ruber TaxID=2027871 RepID=UPI001FF00693|nr:VOC family protein [Planococcus ruber]MCJ1908909.1 VOC family protein [Planococcus ruber]